MNKRPKRSRQSDPARAAYVIDRRVWGYDALNQPVFEVTVQLESGEFVLRWQRAGEATFHRQPVGAQEARYGTTSRPR